jgi:acyl-CoA synthetase (NDP forming)
MPPSLLGGYSLPTWLGTGNPVDIWPAHMVVKQSLTKVLTTTIDAVLDDDEVDAALLIWNLWQPQTYALVCQLLPRLAEAHPDKPLVGCFFGSNAEEGRSKLEASSRIAVFQTPERAIRALGHLARYSAFRRGL